MRPAAAALVALAGASTLAAPRLARADVLPPPTGVLDALWLGPAGLVVLAGMIAAAVLIYRALRRRGRGRGLAIAAALAFYVAADVAVYFVVITHYRPTRPDLDRVG